MTLNIDELGIVWEALFDTRSKAYNIGLKLKVSVDTLDSIIEQYSDPSAQLRETLKAWLKTAAQQKWQTIVDALRSRIIGEPKLARDIEAQYCQGTPGQASGQVLIQNVQQQVQASLQESQRQMQQQLMELKLQMQASTASQRTIERLQQELQEQQRAVEAMQPWQELKQQLSKQQPAARPPPNPPELETTLRKLIWRVGPKSPEAMTRGSIAGEGTTVYCNGHWSTSVYQFDSDTQQWRTLPDLPCVGSTLVMADSKLTSVGGYQGGVTDSLLSLMGELEDRKWLQHFPPMPTKRLHTAAICHDHSLIVAGGEDGLRTLATVEVLNMDTLLWSIATSLAHSFSQATTSICGDTLYLLGGSDQTGRRTRSVLSCPISKLLHSCYTLRQSTIWRHVVDAPYSASSCATLCGHLVAVGGVGGDNKFTTAVSIYDERTDSWLPMEAMRTPRYWTLVATLHNNTMLVIGGNGLDTVEIALLS